MDIGSHPVLLESVWHCDAARVYLKQLVAAACPGCQEEARGPGVSRWPDLVEVCYCRAGEKRSVAMAVILYHCLRSYGWGSQFLHLCDLSCRR